MQRILCSGVPFLIVPTSSGSEQVPQGTTYTWDPPSVTNASLTGGGAGTSLTYISGILTNETDVVQTATYTIFPSTTFCPNNSFTLTVTVNPIATIALLSTTVCTSNPFSVTPSATLPGNRIPIGTTYGWGIPTLQNASLTGGESKSGETNVFGFILNPTNTTYYAQYFVTPRSGTCNGAIFQVLAYIQPKPLITEMSTTNCSGSITVTPANITNGVVPASTVYTWSTPSYSSSSLSGGNSGTQTGGITQILSNSSISIPKLQSDNINRKYLKPLIFKRTI